MSPGPTLVKAHAYGNDFLYLDADAAEQSGLDPPSFARRVCERHTGIGADGLILYRETPAGASMRLLNADGSPAEVSGNGVRGLAALLARRRGLGERARAGAELVIDTDAGPKRLTLVGREGSHRFRFRADMGPPSAIAPVSLEAAGERFEAVRLWMGNPQCVTFGALNAARLARLGPALQTHEAFPQGVNVELAEVAAPDRIRILIWERGVGPTRSSGTGSCAAAVAAAFAGLAGRTVDVAAPGGSQQVEWTDATVWLTGWAEVLCEAVWVA
jgi:diaminopimelate epimerase